ncbi:hypothetical protein KBI51_00450 [Aerococcaceae bacterium zg-ZUI334]|uniref:hypothetical protein n=1 Tax=Aerococcaceae bacterium zg-252 TaxID=2796928 RepID=UPI001B9CAEB4|nr:hypothetical protein [Aerococcaceae bacterium zg-ZUI334]
MDYKNIKHKKELINFKNKVLKDISDMLDLEINQNQKRAANITYWLRDYNNYLKQEKTFSPKYLPTYPYGSIVELNLGFNVGNEFGGLHYGIVMNTKDSKYNPNLTIIPLSSMKEGKSTQDLHPTEIFLGNEFYLLVSTKIDTLLGQIGDTLTELESQPTIDKGKVMILQSDIAYLTKCQTRFLKMKYGSYALTSHITTVSKMRVCDPLTTKEPLSGIQLTTISMKKISDRVRRNTCTYEK